MTALGVARDTKEYAFGPVPQKFSLPLKAGVKSWQGGLVAIDLLTGWAQPATTRMGLLLVGCAFATVDNTLGGNGDASVVVLSGAFFYATAGGGDLLTASSLGQLAYVVDDQTLARTSGGGTRSLAGPIVAFDASLGPCVLLGFVNAAAALAGGSANQQLQVVSAQLVDGTVTLSTGFYLTAASVVNPVLKTPATNGVLGEHYKTTVLSTGISGAASLRINAIDETNNLVDTDQSLLSLLIYG